MFNFLFIKVVINWNLHIFQCFKICKKINCIIQWIPSNLITYLCLSQFFLIADFIKHPVCVSIKLRNGHHITLIWQIFSKKGSIHDDDVPHDDDDGHKHNDHDNPADYGDNDNFAVNIIIIIIIITNDDDDVDGVVYDDGDDH